MERHKIVLIHGYFRTYRDMKTLKKYLDGFGYDAICVDLPLTFSKIDKGVLKFGEFMKEIISSLGINEKISLVGHSTGGLIIRKFLLDNSQYINYVNKCVLISTPNNGSELAGIVNDHFKIFSNIFKTLKSLDPREVVRILPLDDKSIKIGAIAGNKCDLITAKLLPDINDGRVTVSSVECEDLDNFIILPYNHEEIHHKKKTAKLIHNFIQKGSFK